LPCRILSRQRIGFDFERSLGRTCPNWICFARKSKWVDSR
jgi:hypothetical protein